MAYHETRWLAWRLPRLQVGIVLLVCLVPVWMVVSNHLLDTRVGGDERREVAQVTQVTRADDGGLVDLGRSYEVTVVVAGDPATFTQGTPVAEGDDLAVAVGSNGSVRSLSPHWWVTTAITLALITPVIGLALWYSRRRLRKGSRGEGLGRRPSRYVSYD